MKALIAAAFLSLSLLSVAGSAQAASGNGQYYDGYPQWAREALAGQG
jgi:hypothetical protein